VPLRVAPDLAGERRNVQRRQRLCEPPRGMRRTFDGEMMMRGCGDIPPVRSQGAQVGGSQRKTLGSPGGGSGAATAPHPPMRQGSPPSRQALDFAPAPF